MTMAQFETLAMYWNDNPPLHMLAAAWLGIKPAPVRSPPAGDLVRLLGGDSETGGRMRL